MKEESWIKNYWRPAIAWQYLAVCVFDFIIFPLLYMKFLGSQWEPLTLKESGFYHLSMASIIGVSAWTRGQEKIRRMGLDAVEEVETTTTTQTPTRRK